jgi:beta-lactam-binding protein with PASTA domain
VVSLTQESATVALQGAGFEVNVRFQELPANSPNAGRVISQSPPPDDEVPVGTAVTIVIGEAEVPVETTTTVAPVETTTTAAPVETTTTAAPVETTTTAAPVETTTTAAPVETTTTAAPVETTTTAAPEG